jgi:hypothetical protein
MAQRARTLISIWAMVLITGSGLLLRAYGAERRTTITREQIANALLNRGIHVKDFEIESLCDVTAIGAEAPVLQVVSIDPIDANTTSLRLKCAQNGVCLPFYVLLHWQDPGEANDTLRKWQVRKPAQVTGQHLNQEELLVRSGKIATLVLASARSRITIPVVCLQNGARGQNVRVLSKDSKKIYLAEVIAAGVVSSEARN